MKGKKCLQSSEEQKRQRKREQKERLGMYVKKGKELNQKCV